MYYFAHFLIIVPIISRLERPKPLPNSITEAVLGDKGGSRMSETALSA
jgi:ubiquinol-cytochrome c reductase cytochrome b subunit